MYQSFQFLILVVLAASTTVSLNIAEKKIATTEKSEFQEKENSESQENHDRMLTMKDFKFEPAEQSAGEVKEEGNYFEGDIDLLDDQKDLLNPRFISFRTGTLDENYRWPKSEELVNVPYIIDKVISNIYHGNIDIAFRILKKFTCIRFVQRRNEEDYVNFTVLQGCSSQLGRRGGQQPISLDKGCTDPGIILHEIIHTLGYTHMHNHEERDERLDIKWENIQEEKKLNFEKVGSALWGNFDTSFDHHSLMMYGPHAFSKNGKETIVLKKDKNYLKTIGQRGYFSRGDQMRINNMYECPEWNRVMNKMQEP